MELIIGSNKPKAEVIPANNIAKNNNGAKRRPIEPITLKIVGNTMNINPVPSEIKSAIWVPLAWDIYPRMENTPNAVQISKMEFDATTQRTLSTNLAFSGK